MKLVRSSGRSVVVAVLAATLAASGCGDDPAAPEGPEPTFVGTWAGERWEGQASASYGMTADTLYFHGSSPVSAEWNVESFVTVRVAYAGPGTYTLGPDDGTFTRLLGGDVAVARYGTVTDDAGTLTLVEHPDGRVTGVVEFEARDVMGPSPDPAVVRFEGSFEAVLPE